MYADTTRIDEQELCNMTWRTIHGGGTRLIRTGFSGRRIWLQQEEFDSSRSIHESQSRLWYELCGRGTAFWPVIPKIAAVLPQRSSTVHLLNTCCTGKHYMCSLVI
jgi:carboxypeptidase Taq